jgi:hypothetical protein
MCAYAHIFKILFASLMAYTKGAFTRTIIIVYLYTYTYIHIHINLIYIFSVCTFGVAYTNGAYTLLWERAGTKLKNKQLKKNAVDQSG